MPTLGTRNEFLLENLSSLKKEGADIFVSVVRPIARAEIDKEIGQLVDQIIDDPKKGLSGAINKGIALLPDHVTYVNWLGDDDLLDAKALEEARHLMERQPTLGLVYGNCRYIGSDSQLKFIHKPKFPRKFLTRYGPNQIAQPAVLFRRSVFHALNGLDEGLQYAMDLDLWLRIFLIKRSTRYLNTTLASYRWHSDSLSSINDSQARVESSVVRRKYLSKAAQNFEIFASTLANWLIARFGSRLDRIFWDTAPPK